MLHFRLFRSLSTLRGLGYAIFELCRSAQIWVHSRYPSFSYVLNCVRAAALQLLRTSTLSQPLVEPLTNDHMGNETVIYLKTGT